MRIDVIGSAFLNPALADDIEQSPVIDKAAGVVGIRCVADC
jgi:hypothetical protein